MSEFPLPITGNPDNNLESLCSINGLKTNLKENVSGLLLPGKLAALPHHPQRKKTWQSRSREYKCSLYFFPQ
jgi:hypothetical protein